MKNIANRDRHSCRTTATSNTRDADKKAMYWALERMAQEMRAPQPGSELIVQQLAFMLVIQALRLHADDSTTPRTGWLFALRDKKLRAAIACMHDAPGQGWTVETLATQVGMSRSAFAQHFSQTVGMAPAACLTQWRMLLACDRLQQTDDSVLHIATSLV